MVIIVGVALTIVRAETIIGQSVTIVQGAEIKVVASGPLYGALTIFCGCVFFGCCDQ